ncbi:ADP-ribosyltransferase, partial [Streptomyces sp. NPDC051217]|uniref:ADP-ribosyltransferase n=1 Tax=Streptomyces sp. NPDC051217 TaxID=3365644 RepID=UPI0037970E67
SDGGSDGGGSDGGGSSGGVICNPVMAPWGIMQNCTETGTGGSDNGGGDNGGSDNGGGDSGGGDNGGSDNGGGDNGGSDNGGGDSGGGNDGGGDNGGGDSGGGDDGGSDGGSDGGGSDGGGSSGGVICNPVMAPWGIMQSCTETGTGGSDNGGSSGGENENNDDNNDDEDKDDEDKDDEDKDDEDKDDEDKDDEDKDDEDKKDDCRDTNVAYFGPVTTGAAGDGRYTLASAGTRTPVVYSGSGSMLLAAPGDPSPADLAMSISGSSIAGVDTYQEAEDRLSDALGLTDEPKPKPAVKPKPPHLKGCPVKTPMNVLDDIPDYKAGKDGRKEWSEAVEKIAKQNPMTEDFTAEDALTIADYSGYKAETVNKWLRDPANSDSDPNELRDKMDRALEHLPPVEGTFYRGTFMPDEMIKKFASGETVEFPEYLSTSSDPAKADRALKKTEAKNIPGGENVLLEIETDNGRNIDPLSRYRGLESEVLVPRGGQFEKVGETTKMIGGKEYKVIKVKQVG